MYTQYLHTRVFLHDNVASYLPFSLSYNATVLVTLFFPYRALAAHQGVEDKIRGRSGINKPNTVAIAIRTTYVTEAFLLPEVTTHYTRCSAKFHH